MKILILSGITGDNKYTDFEQTIEKAVLEIRDDVLWKESLKQEQKEDNQWN